MNAPERTLLRPGGSARHQVLLIHGRTPDLYPGDALALEYGGVLLDPDAIGKEPWSYVALGHFHVQHEVRPRMWYSGALDYVSPNLWGELVEEQVRGAKAKGWLLVELESGKVTPQPVPASRTVFDVPPLDAGRMSAAEIDRLIAVRLAEVPGGLSDSIVRLVVHNIPRHLSRELDHAALRAAKAQALQLQVEFLPPDLNRQSGSGAPGRRQTLPETVADFLRRRPLPERVSRDRFVALGLELLGDSQETMTGQAG